MQLFTKFIYIDIYMTKNSFCDDNSFTLLDIYLLLTYQHS